MRSWCNFLLILSLAILQSKSQSTSTYNAAVVDYSPLIGNSTVNAQEYVRLIAQVTNSTTDQIDIIVFPEMTLNAFESVGNTTATFLPQGNDSNVVLCTSNSTDYADFLKLLSCAAIQYNVSVVVNLWEKENNCTDTNCTSSVLVYYNTNVVLSSNGTVTAVYRKWNLFGETGLNTTTNPEIVTFQIRNVTFGIFTCFDIMFGVPALNLTRNLGVKNIVFPTMWFSELPYLTALQAQQMWAHENDVLLLASGANIARAGSGGSGIFVGSDGALDIELNSDNSTRVIYYQVPNLEVANTSASRNVTAVQDSEASIDLTARNMDGFALLTDSSIRDHNSTVLNTTQSANVSHQVCHGSNPRICCLFDLTFSVSNATSDNTSSQYVYQLLAFNGVRTFSGVRNGGVEICAVAACLNSSVSSCGARFSNYSQITWPVTFNNISVSANFTESDNRIQFPNSLLASIRPIHAQFTTWEKLVSNGTVMRTHTLNNAQNRLLTFGIFGRDFSRDTRSGNGSDSGSGGNSSTTVKVNTTLACIAILLLFFFKF